MSGEEQERFEDYLELENYINELQAGHVAHPPEGLTPEKARIYRMAALFRSGSTENTELRPEFVISLHNRLEQEFEATQATAHVPAVQKEPQAEEQPSSSAPPSPAQAHRRSLSRRGILAGGAAAAASLAVGIGLDRMITKQTAPHLSNQATATPTSPAYPSVLVGDSWHLAATFAQLANGPVRFVTDTIVGYVISSDSEDVRYSRGQVIAISAACTHMGCIVQWQESDRKFHCPCHAGLFSEYGEVDQSSGPILYLTPLPRLEAKVENGNVYVKVPTRPK